MPAALALILLAAPASAASGASEPALTVSSAPLESPRPPAVRVGLQVPSGSQGRSFLGAGVGLKEGPMLEAMVWGGTGAVIGSFAGPAGAAVGGAAGSVVGLLYSFLVVPRIQPAGPPGRAEVRQRAE